MALLEKHLVVKKSTIPGAGKGLFTTKFIPKGAQIVEYKGKVSTWKEVDHQGGFNAYIYYVNRNHVIDGSLTKNLARYANDAKGARKINALKNNCVYVQDKNHRVFIEAKKDIPENNEILVGYGKEYWDVLGKNHHDNPSTKEKNNKKKTSNIKTLP